MLKLVIESKGSTLLTMSVYRLKNSDTYTWLFPKCFWSHKYCTTKTVENASHWVKIYFDVAKIQNPFNFQKISQICLRFIEAFQICRGRLWQINR